MCHQVEHTRCISTDANRGDWNGVILADALESKGLVTARLGIADLPGLQELSVHQGVVLVDVSARDLTTWFDEVAVDNIVVREHPLVVGGATGSFVTFTADGPSADEVQARFLQAFGTALFQAIP